MLHNLKSVNLDITNKDTVYDLISPPPCSHTIVLASIEHEHTASLFTKCYHHYKLNLFHLCFSRHHTLMFQLESEPDSMPVNIYETIRVKMKNLGEQHR